MVTINTTDDLIRALQEQPDFLEAARNLILSQEVTDTPNRLDRISEQIAELFRAMAETDRRLEEYVATTNRIIEQFNQRFDRMESDMAEVKADVSVLKTDMVEVKAKLDRQTGIILEQQVHDIILNIAKDHLDMTRTAILKSRLTGGVTRRLEGDIETAEDNGDITEDEAENLRLVDLIIRGRRRSDRVHVHVAIEVSQTVNNNDIIRARDRAKTLAAVTGTEAMAVVIGAIVSPPQQALADREGVQVVIPAMFSE